MTLKEAYKAMFEKSPIECLGIDYERIEAAGWENSPKTDKPTPFVKLRDRSGHSYTVAEPRAVKLIRHCVICNERIEGYGCDPSPVFEGGEAKCCWKCFGDIVLPKRAEGKSNEIRECSFCHEKYVGYGYPAHPFSDGVVCYSCGDRYLRPIWRATEAGDNERKERLIAETRALLVEARVV